jgi:acyl-CoA reductase-like NAD-dependent aldehyde dehydrogenase
MLLTFRQYAEFPYPDDYISEIKGLNSNTFFNTYRHLFKRHAKCASTHRKPSPYTLYCDLKLGELASRVFPPGVVQVLSGDDNLGPWITEHPGIDKIAFTGSITTGKLVAASCAKTLKRCVLEFGGNDAAIVSGDVDIDKYLPKITTLSFLNSGQVCMLMKRIYVHESIYNSFRDQMVEFTKTNIKTGSGTQDGVVVAPLQNKMQYVAINLTWPHLP